MSPSRLIDLFAILVVAAVLLIPAPSIDAYPAVQGDKADLDRVSFLQDAVYRDPGDANTGVELARAYLAVDHPEWALATLRRVGLAGSKDYKVHQVAAYAYATLLQAKDALLEAEAGLAACEADPGGCSDVARIRLSYLAEMMRKPVEAGVDPKKDPLRAKQLVSEALHATKAPPLPSPDDKPASAKTPAPGTSLTPGGAAAPGKSLAPEKSPLPGGTTAAPGRVR